MAGSLNKVMLIGYVGADPEVRATPNGSQVATFRLACSESWKDKDGNRQERTEWVTCVAWRKLAETLQRYLRKGAHVYLEGKLQTRSWEDKNGGGKRYATEVLVEDFKWLDKKSDTSNPGDDENQRGMGSGRSLADAFPPSGSGPDDDLPFDSGDYP